MILLSILFLGNKCTDRKLVCAQIKTANIKALPLCDVKYIAQQDRWRCRCRCFDLDDYKTVDDLKCGENFRTDNYPLAVCDGLSGFFPEDWAQEIRPKIKKLKRLHNNLCD